jgi:REP element-mobilizing transposase RayT
MARKQRIHYPAALYHVILRGNAQQDIFFEDGDRYRFYLLLQNVVEKFGCRIHAYCLMTNHAHIAIQVGETPLSRIMQNLSLRYTTWINRRMNRSGHLFQGRYKAVLVDADSYLLELVAYIHLNPVRAAMVTAPEEYPWSSHLAYLGTETVPWLTTEQVLSVFGTRRGQAARLFSLFVGERTGGGYNKEFHQGGEFDSRLLGEERFVDEALEKAQSRREQKPTIPEVLEAIKTICNIDDETLCCRQRGRSITEVRTLAAWAVAEFSDGTISEAGQIFRRDISTLSACIKRMTAKAHHDSVIAGRMELVKQALRNQVTQHG